MYRVINTVFLFLIISFAAAQHSTTHASMLWFNYSHSLRIAQHWSIGNDVQVRTWDWTERWSQFGVRTGATYQLNKHFSASAGFAWFGTARYINDDIVIPNEWRPWEEIAYVIKCKKIDFSQRLRLEQRFFQQLAGSKKLSVYKERTRLRYRFEFTLPIKKEKIEVAIGNEVMINPGHLNDSLAFDQNRTFIHLNYRLSEHTTFQFQFIKLIQWQAAGNLLDDQNVFRFGINQKFDLRHR